MSDSKNFDTLDKLKSIDGNVSYKKSKFINRNLSFIAFNIRVLKQAIANDVPFMEKLKFLAITGSNLDEFIRVRLTASYLAFKNNPQRKDISGLTHEDELKMLLTQIKQFRDQQNRIFGYLRKELRQKKVNIVKIDSLDKDLKKKSRDIFINYILPSLTPIAYESTKETPFMKSGDLTLVVEASDREYSKTVFTFVPINKALDRLVCIDHHHKVYVFIEDLIKSNINLLFNRKHIHYVGLFKVLRQGDVQLKSNNEISIVDRMEEIIYQREKADPIFLEIEKDMPKRVIKVIKELLHIKNKFIYSTNIMDFKFLSSVDFGIDDYYEPFTPKHPEEFLGSGGIMEAIEEDDIILAHPYDSYEPVVDLIREAAEDPNVLVIRNTLYRVSSENSPIVDALCRASRKGKQVCVLLELKARFDEEQNISLIEKMVRAGIQISYGLENLKTHCKMLSIIKNDNGELVFYSHIGTGNYNDKTAKMYSDISYFTFNRKIGEDLINIFNFISGFTHPNPIKSKRVFYSPKTLRGKIEKLIDVEIENVKKGKEGKVILKLNSISDKRMIEKIYEASEKGVKFDIIVRGLCSIKPINNNIVIKSIVGRFLEHSRIYYFFNAGEPKIFISSADFLTRNLDRRVEVLVEIVDKACRHKLMQIISLNIEDTRNSFYMHKSGGFIASNQFDTHNKKNQLNLFEELINSNKDDIIIPKKRKKKI